MIEDLPCVGTMFELAAGLRRVEWFGASQVETYPDRRLGMVGHYAADVDQLFTPYVRPQEAGGRNGVPRFRVSAPDGRDVVVYADEPRQVSWNRYRATDLDVTRHHEELTARENVVVHLDAAHRGLGTASCGPDTLPQHLVRGGRHTWQWTLSL